MISFTLTGASALRSWADGQSSHHANNRGMTAHDAKACFRVLVLTFPNSQGHVLDDETEAAIAKADALLDSHGVAPVPTFH